MSSWGYNERYVSAVVSMAAGVINSKDVFDSRRCRRSIEQHVSMNGMYPNNTTCTFGVCSCR